MRMNARLGRGADDEPERCVFADTSGGGWNVETALGRIINITSIVGEMGAAGQVNYAASKAGLIGLTLSVAREIASRNITVNAVAPGYIATAMTDALSDEQKQAITAQIPLGRQGRRGYCQRSAVFGQQRGGLHYRPRSGRERRNADAVRGEARGELSGK